ncbi:katanin p80 WD40 repeat-containing subunit B1 homolog isoform X1 [Amborella trichopoda]|uniref:katanin p80 WD40 repeat-containing subunit B1 homolog isoform X1 n=1 Tax=Amborella trichopoda TaxID=13333 RepID=UPI0005D2D603|nr:katanin p80 WD40 repeat-containing subunit B1 homolog isoform X1 [Amborella trichopoda]|eukprot:XP_006848621.2 katanin p80 WD40 repeat-containing subunit B1 homolog isoform X1 [Amborella trichopoda]
MKRAYKLQEFVAHSSNVNCLKIGKKSSRVLVTGGEDHKVNLWAIGKPNAILSLSGHTSAVESVSFDSAEVLVAAGAASGTIKLWDLEEAKIVRTLTGHRSNCISVDFHPFGEFFASGSLDTNLKIWDIRRKGCIHTYKGHTRGVNAIRFTPDGRWVVSGGEDNVVKLWDLTAGKLLHDFKCHEGQIQCIDFHPHEFLLATGSADKTVKFWDLETFELIGSAGPEASGVRSMTFNPDGRTLLCGLHESLKVFSWEPIRCHDAVDVGWSRLADLNIHEGKLLGCSYNQSCVGVWVVDISRVGPYAATSLPRSNGHSESKSGPSGNQIVHQSESTTVKVNIGRLSISQNSDTVVKEPKNSLPMSASGSVPGTPQRLGLNNGPKVLPPSSTSASSASSLKRSVGAKVQPASNLQMINKPEIVPVIVPRSSARVDQSQSLDSRKESSVVGRTIPYSIQAKLTEPRKLSVSRDDPEKVNVAGQSGPMGHKSTEMNEGTDQNFLSGFDNTCGPTTAPEGNRGDIRYMGAGKHRLDMNLEPPANYSRRNFDGRLLQTTRETSSIEVPGGRTRSLVASWERRETSPSFDASTTSYSSETMPEGHVPSLNLRGHSQSVEREMAPPSDESVIDDVIRQRDQFMSSMQSRLTKLQVVRRFWERNDVKGAINAMQKMSDHSVFADVISILMEKSDSITLEICTCLLPLLSSLLDSKMDRHIGISLEALLKLVRVFGPVIHSTLSASSSVGVDLQAEQRLERCNLCFIELEKVKHAIPSLAKKGGSVAKFAQELNLTLQDVL